MKGDAQDELVDALIARAGGDGRVVAARRRDWWSCTFEGERHEIALAIPAAASATFAHGIDDAEFVLDGHFVASIAIVGERVDDSRATVAIEALTMIFA